ncbi:hypothetical protein FXN57_08535 [Aggregatibacter actinomycetemcomitans]|nr:hypothetical protein FXN57_08535 [Aggregatibacter actinomycetemcomitans]
MMRNSMPSMCCLPFLLRVSTICLNLIINLIYVRSKILQNGNIINTVVILIKFILLRLYCCIYCIL